MSALQTECLNPTPQPCDRILTREAWAELNRGIQWAIETAPTDEIKLQIAAFKLDVNRELDQKFRVVGTK